MEFTRRSAVACAIATALLLAIGQTVMAQGVTTGSMTGVVRDAQGAVVPGVTITVVHEPSGTVYEAVSRGDGRFDFPALRVGGPYTVKAVLAGFNTEVQKDLTVSLGTSTDVVFTLKVASVSETVTVEGKTDPVFASSRTGAATAVLRDELGSLPTVSGRINDMTRLSPEYSGSGSFVGVDNRSNNITVDGSYFNNSFGLAGQPGDRTGVAPISLEAIEQVQVSIAPFDVRQGNFVGAGVNTVTRSGTNMFVGSGYYRYRNQSFVGTDAAGQAYVPGTFKTTDIGEWLGGPILKNKLFFFESYEHQKDTRPLNTYVANNGSQAITGNVTRVLASDLDTLSAYLKANFGYDTGPYQGIMKTTPATPFLVKADYNLNGSNRISFRYNMLNSNTPVNLSSSTSAGNGRSTFSSNFLNYAASNYTILENIRSGILEWNSFHGSSLANTLIAGYTHQDESRGAIAQMFPFVDILDGSGTTYTSFGAEPFTPNNKLKYNTFQLQDSVTKYGKNHSLTFGGSLEKYHSYNVFFPESQSVYVYNTLSDFYTDANAYLANPSRTGPAPVTLKLFQVRYMNIPGYSEPVQPLDVWYVSGYAQDEWRPRSNLTLTAGVRVDVAKFGPTAYDNYQLDSLTFRDPSGNPVTFNSGGMPKASPLWSPRVGFNWDVAGDRVMQVRGGTGVFTGKPPYVWISNQVGQTGMLTGFIATNNTTAYPFNPNINSYKPTTVTGAPATSTEFDVTVPDYKFPQTWRSNIGVDRKLPWWGLVATGEAVYSRDVHGTVYYNADMPAAQQAYVGVDNRMHWVATTAYPTCASAGQTYSASNPTGACVTRLNNLAGDQVTQTFVLANESQGNSFMLVGAVTKPLSHGFQMKAAYSYGVSKSLVDPGTTASTNWGSNPVPSDPNNPPLAYSATSPGKRFFLSASYTKQYFGFGATTVAAFYDVHTYGNNSYIFSGDANGDTYGSNDLIFIPRSEADMNFTTFTATANGVTRTFTAQDQANAFEAYINQDSYLSSHRGQYAQRGAVFYPMVGRLDLAITQDVFHNIGGRKHSGQIRLDITNFGNLLNHNWGVGVSMVKNAILTNPTTDANGKLAYRLAYVSTATGPALVSQTFQTTAGTSDVYVMMLSFRYTFQ